MTHPTFLSAFRRAAVRAGSVMAIAVGGLAAMGGPASGQVSGPTWTQYQGGVTHPGSEAEGPTAPYVVEHTAPFSDLPGGSSESLGLSAPVVSGDTAIVVGPTSIRAVSLGDGGVDWSEPRAFGPSVPAAITGTDLAGGIGCVRCQSSGPVVIYSEGWGFGPGDPTSSATPTTSVRPQGSPSFASPTASMSPTSPPSRTSSPAPGDQATPQVLSDVMARSVADGSKMWEAPVELKATSRTGVIVDGSTAYVGDIQGNVYAIDAMTGKIQWTTNVGGFLESPLAASDGTLLVSVNGYNTDNAKLVAITESTGKVAWVYDTGHSGYLTSPAVADGRVLLGVTLFGSTGSVPSLVSVDLAKGGDANGGSTWESHLAGPMTFATTPSVSGNQVFVEDVLGDVFAVDRTSGKREWMFATNSTFGRGALLVVGKQVLVPTDVGALVVLDATTGHQVFSSTDAGGPLQYPAVVGTDRVVFTTGGPTPGIATFTHATSGAALTDIPSPTTANYGKIVGDFGIAVAGIAVLSLLVFRPLSKRMGPAFFVEEDEPTDPERQDA